MTEFQLATTSRLPQVKLTVKRSAPLFVLMAAISVASGADRHVVFERGDAIYIANLDFTLVRKLATGIFPAISPDGKRVAFTVVEKSATTYLRHLATIDITSGKVAVLDRIPGDNVYNATWSPDGKWIAFTMRDNGLWHLAKVQADGAGFGFIRKGKESEVTFYSPCWSHDGASIYCQDMTNLYKLALDGSVQAQWKIDKIIPNGDMSGDGRIDIAPGGNRLLLSVDMDEEHTRKNWDGPVPALWSFDVDTQIAVRLTSKNVFAWDGCWLDNANMLFLSQSAGENEPSIYRTNGRNLKRMIENSRRPDVNAP